MVQVAQAIAEPVKVVLASPPQQPGAPSVVTVHLAPLELGRVDIRIERPADGPARVELAVERPDTLFRLLHDQPALQQALDQAGIPPTGRTIHFTLSPDSASANGFSSSLSGDSASNGGGQRSQNGYPNHPSRPSEPFDMPANSTRWARSGLDITA